MAQSTTLNPGGESTRQLAELRALAGLVRALSSTLELSQVLNQIVDAATTLTNAEEGMLLLPDEAGTTLYIRAMKGVENEKARNFRIKTSDSLAGHVLTYGEPILKSDQGPQKVKTEYFVQSLVYVPLVFKGQTIGVLGVNNRNDPRTFTLHDQELLLDLASQAAIALENARLYERQVQQTRQLGILVEAGQAVNSTLALDQVLVRICQLLTRVMGVSGCMIGQRDAETNQFYLMASTNHLRWLPGDGPTPPKALLDRVIKPALDQNAYAVFRRDVGASRAVPEIIAYLEEMGSDQMAIVPLRLESQPVGVVILFYVDRLGKPPQVTSTFRQHVRALAAEIGAAAGDRAFTMSQTLLDQTGATRVGIWLLDNEQQPRQTFDYGDSAWPNGLRYLSAEEALGPKIFEQGIPIKLSADKDNIPAASRDLGIQAILHLPLKLKDRQIGVVSLFDTRSSRNFSEADIDLAQAIVLQTASAIENARLFHDLEDSLTELKATQAKLVQAARLSAIGELAAVVAHQINNPLTAVLGNAEYLLQDVPPSDPVREPIETIHRAGKRAHTVVGRLLGLSRNAPSAGPGQTIDVNESIRAVLDLVTAYVQHGQVTLNVNLAPTLMTVSALPGQLEDVWINLLMNARHAVRGVVSGTLWVRSGAEDDCAVVTISDNGHGIALENQPHLFKAFFTTKPVGEGTGLGLYICKQIIDQVGGSIDLRSSVGHGTEFIVRLPLSFD